MTTFLTTTSITNNNLTNTLTTTTSNTNNSSTPRTTTATNSTNNDKENLNSTTPTKDFLAKYPNFSKCVSFNNLHPPEYESDFPYTTPIYNLNNPSQQHHHLFDSNYTFGSSSGSGSTPKIFIPFQDFNFGNGSNNNTSSSGTSRRHSSSAGTTSTGFTKRKRLKLPPPPAKSILKNKVSQQQVEYNNMFENISEATIEYHKQEREQQEQQEQQDEQDEDSQSGSGSGNSSVNSSPLLTATNISTPINDLKETQQLPTPRRKSLVGLTDEELMALDPQFQTTKSKNNDLDKFKFDNQKTYYLSPSTRKGSTSDGATGANGNVATGVKRQDYPTSNENNYKSISLTVRYGETTHNDYTRTLLTIISGRRHTWHSLDWLFHIKQDLQNQPTLLADGDYLVIAGLIPIKFIKDYNNSNKKKKLSVEDYLYQKCCNLLNYLMEYISQLNLKLKITVEFVIDYENENESLVVGGGGGDSSKPLKGEKYMIDHLFKQYQPNLIIIGNKSSNLNFKYPVKMNKLNNLYLIKLSSYIVKYSTIPVILVGLLIGFNDDTTNTSSSSSSAVKFNKPTITFSISKTPSSELTPKHSQTTSCNKSSSTPDLSDDHDADDNSSIESIESLTPKEYTDDKKRQEMFNEKMTEINNTPFNSPDKYFDWIQTISDNSLQALKNYLIGIKSKDDSIIIDDKIHAIYKSQTWNVNSGSMSHDDLSDGNGGNGSMYKVKSLISIEDDEEVKRKQEELRMKKRNKRNSSVKSSGSVGGFIHSIKSNDNNSIISLGDKNTDKNKNNSTDKSTKRKSSIWKKLGFLKG